MVWIIIAVIVLLIKSGHRPSGTGAEPVASPTSAVGTGQEALARVR